MNIDKIMVGIATTRPLRVRWGKGLFRIALRVLIRCGGASLGVVVLIAESASLVGVPCESLDAGQKKYAGKRCEQNLPKK